MSKRKNINYDRVLQDIGLCGIPTGEQNLSSVFTQAKQDHWCRGSVAGNISLPNSTSVAIDKQCQEYDLSKYINGSWNNGTVAVKKCQSGWEYDRVKDRYSTTNSKFDLVCDSRYVLSIITSIYMFGFLVGCTASGIISDRFGRIKALVLSATFHIIFGITAALAPNLYMYMFCRFVVGACASGTFTTSFVIAMEIIGPHYRMHTGVFVQGWFALGFLLVAILAAIIKTNYILQIVIALQPVIFLPYFWMYPESPRWLLSQGKTKEAEIITKKMAKHNKYNCENFKLDDYEMFEEDETQNSMNEKETEVQQPHKGSVIDLVRTPNMRKRSFNIFFNWFVNSLVYYGLSLNAEGLGGGSIYLNTILSGIIELPAYALCCLTINRFGRTKLLVAFLTLGGVACMSSAFVPIEALKVALAMVGKFGISGSFAVIYVYSAEVFPTVVRNIGVGVSSTHSRIGALLAPLIIELKSVWEPLPLLLIGVSSIAAGVLSLLLPETLGKPLPETLEDGENFGLNKVHVAMKELNDKNSLEEHNTTNENKTIL